MEEVEKNGTGSQNTEKVSDCGCDGNCCPPKKRTL